MTDPTIKQLLAQLGADSDFRELVRANPRKALYGYGLSPQLEQAVNANTSDSLRGLSSQHDIVDQLFGVQTSSQTCPYTCGGSCSSACTKAGCFPGPGCPKST